MSNVPPLEGPAVSSPQVSPVGPLGGSPESGPIHSENGNSVRSDDGNVNQAGPAASPRASLNKSLILVVVLIVMVAFVAGRGNGGPEDGAASNGAVTTLVTGTTMSPEETLPASMLDVALQFHNQGRLDDAIRAYEAVLSVDPTNKFAFYNIGVIAQGRKEYDSAIENYDKALALDPNFNPALYNRGLVHRDNKQIDKAIADFTAVISADPRNASAMWNLGQIYVAEGRTAEGSKLITDALTINPALQQDGSGGSG